MRSKRVGMVVTNEFVEVMEADDGSYLRQAGWWTKERQLRFQMRKERVYLNLKPI